MGLGFMAAFAVSGSVVLIARQVHKRLLSDFMKKMEVELAGMWWSFFSFSFQVLFFVFFYPDKIEKQKTKGLSTDRIKEIMSRQEESAICRGCLGAIIK